MTAYQHSQKLGLDGTDEEIVAVLQTLTARDVSAADIAAWMREEGLWIVGPKGSAGKLYDLWKSTDSPDVRDGLSEWYASTLAGQAAMVRATRPDIAPRIARIAGLMAVAIPDGERLRADFYAMCGGLMFADLTVEQFAKQRAESEAKAAREAAYSAVVNRLNYVRALTVAAKDSGATPEEIETAAVDAWNTWPPEPDDDEPEIIDDTGGIAR